MNGYYFVNTHLANKRGHTIQVFNTVSALNTAGVSVAIVAPKYENVHVNQELFSYYRVADPFIINTLFNFFFKKASVYSFIFFNVSSIWFLIRKRVYKKPDFIYFRSEYFLPLAFAARILRVPYYYEIHRIGLSKRQRMAITHLAKHASGLVVLTQVLKDKFLPYNKNICVAHDAVQVSDFNISIPKSSARGKLSIPEEGIIISYVGSVNKIKGVDIILQVAQQFPRIQFYIVGSIDEAFTRQLTDLPSNVHTTGPYQYTDAPLWMAAADLLLITHPEGPLSQSPMKLFEYIASERPILSSDLPNIREVLHGPGALFYRAGDKNDFARAIQNYLDNKNGYDEKGRENIKLAQENSWENRGKKIASFMQSDISRT